MFRSKYKQIDKSQDIRDLVTKYQLILLKHVAFFKK